MAAGLAVWKERDSETGANWAPVLESIEGVAALLSPHLSTPGTRELKYKN